MEKYDVIVLGFGKAGKTLAGYFAKKGKKIALIEENDEMYGGTCINIGCIPTKTMISNIDKCNSLDELNEIRNAVVTKLRNKNYNMLNDNENIVIYNGKGRFISNKTIEVTFNDDTKKELSSDIIIINTGAKPNVINIKGLKETKQVYDSTELQKANVSPKTLGILGAGNIGLEFASLYARMGVKVTVIDFVDKVLAREEEEVSEMAKTYLEEEGIEFKLGTLTNEIYNDENGKVVLNTEKYGEIKVDVLMHATGRKANTEGLGLENTEIKLRDNGSIIVDHNCMTNIENVFAVGDVNGGLQFTYISLDDFRIVKNYFEKNEYSMNSRKNVPYSVFINPVLSRVGITEKEAKELKYDYKANTLMCAAMPRCHVNGDTKGLFKVIVDKNTKLILGATLFSRNSEEIINIIKMAMDNNIPYTYIKDQIFTHPTISENLNDVFNI